MHNYGIANEYVVGIVMKEAVRRATEIIRAHKGDIGATSPGLGKGSTFYFKVPAA